MGKNEKSLLLVGILGTLVIFGMAFADRWLYEGDLPPGIPTATLSAEEIADNETKPEDAGEAEIPVGAAAYVIDPFQSEARFSLGETLGGEPVTVVGTTSVIRGIVYFSTDAPEDAQISEIEVDARSLVTDNNYRDRALQGAILSAGSYPTINFVPTSIGGLPETVTSGESVDLEITGDLTIKDVTREVVFSAQVTVVSETQLEGHAETMIAYADYDIFIPSAPRVADVDEEILLEIDFVALTE